MKLKHIHIDAYKVFRDFDFDFCHDGEIQNLVVITGVNGNGKTTLLRDVIGGDYSTPQPKGSITIENEGKEEKFLLPDSFSKDTYKEAFRNVIYYKSDEETPAEHLHEEILRYVDYFVYVLGKTSFEAYGKLQALMEDIFCGFNLQIRFKGIDENKRLIFINHRNEAFGVEGLSNGERQILSKVFPLFMGNIKDCVVLFDEPEESLHPSWQTRLIPVLRRCIKENNCQFVLATHSPQIISSAHKDEIRILVRNEQGNVVVGDCSDNPYGWTVEKVLMEIQKVDSMRVPEVEAGLAELYGLVEECKYETEAYKKKLSEMERMIGYADRDLMLIRMEAIRKKKKNEAISKR